MSVVVGTNSNISVADADIYFSNRVNSTLWFAATVGNKEASLIQGTANLDMSFNFDGVLTDDSQALSFPRTGVVDCEGRDIDSTIIPQVVKDATCEQAYYLLSNPSISGDKPDFKKAKLASMEIEYFDPADTIGDSIIARMAIQLLSCIATVKQGIVTGVGSNGKTMRA